MDWIKLLSAATPIITELVKIAEVAFNHKRKSGKEKKAFVANETKRLLKEATNVSTGGAHENWKQLETVLPDLIDVTANALYVNK